MTELEILEKRWAELIQPRNVKLGPISSNEIEDINLLATQIENLKAQEYEALITELQQKGIFIKSIWDLVNSKKPYPQIIEILIKHLSFGYHHRTKEGIVRSLIVKEAKGKATEALMREFQNTANDKVSLRWIIGYAIGYLMKKEDVNWVVAAVLDNNNKDCRSGMILPLVKIKSEKAEDVLLKLLNQTDIEPGVIIQSIKGLSLLKSKAAKEVISYYLNHSNKDFKKNAKIALHKIG